MTKVTRRRRPALALGALALTGLASGCALGPNFAPPDAKTPAAWSAPSPEAPPSGPPPADWWGRFGDAELSSLIQRASAANLDLRQALLRVEEARAQRSIAGAALDPSLDGGASYANQRLSERTAPTSLLSTLSGAGGPGEAPPGGPGPSLPFPNPFNQFQYGFDASWEIDLFGRVRRSVEAADADTEAARWDSRDVLVSLEGDVARAYLDLRDAQARLTLLRQNLQTQQDSLELARDRNQTGVSPALDVANAGAQASTTEALIPLERSRVTRDIDRLGFLLGQEPEALRGELSAEGAVLPTPEGLGPVGVPADMVRRRPDIRAAEARLHAATARQGVAIADLYPRITLNADVGLQAQRFTDLGAWASRYFGVGPNIEIPIFSGGRRHATVRLEDARAREAGAAYARTVLAALVDVETALSAYSEDDRRRAALERAAAQNQDALDLAKARYGSGVTGFLEVLDAERSLQQNQLALADARTASSTDLVALYKALGGGWDTATSARAEAPQSPADRLAAH